jgi:hypothetical protein
MKSARRVVCLLLALWGACVPLAATPASDRGIGGTGGPASGPEISDRGIGGTGIVGVITGFGSVIINGLEIAYDPSTPLTVDGVSETGAALRVGQLAALVASDNHGLHAVNISVRHEVSGPVTAVSADGDPHGRMLTVAGQQVAIGQGTDGLWTVRPGDWIAVSGLRQPDGVIAASRIDRRMPGPVLVRGPAMPGPGGWQIGELPIRPPQGTSVAPGESITARGTIANGTLSVATASPDVLGSNPAAYFGSHVRRMVIETYVSPADGHVRLGRGWLARAAPGIAVPAGAHRAIVDLERGAHGGFIATHLHGAGRPVAPHRAPFAPERHGAWFPHRAAPHPFRPPPYRPHAWQNRHPAFGRGGYMQRHFGCAAGWGCRRDHRRP